MLRQMFTNLLLIAAAAAIHTRNILLRSAVGRGARGNLADLPCKVCCHWRSSAGRRLDRRGDQGVLPEGAPAEDLPQGVGAVHRSCVAFSR
jgi:hypothetical protein